MANKKARKKASPPSQPPQPVEHGIEAALYNNLPTQHPMILCLCGYNTDEETFPENWEECGAIFDEHLRLTLTSADDAGA